MEKLDKNFADFLRSLNKRAAGRPKDLADIEAQTRPPKKLRK
jgi:hypothetical protein